ncbi:hypothetical protein M1N47_02455 [Dehalococcoidia bacterium]|nr:hypothetical protein [Dehalococcoidia bacterium]
MVKIEDEPKARTRRKTFNYIREGDTLWHISKYAISQRRKGDEKAWTITYDIPEEKIKGKQIYEFYFTNSGGFAILKYAAELVEERSKNLEHVSKDEWHKLQFHIESDETRALISEGRKVYCPMIDETKKFVEKMGKHILLSERVNDWFEDATYGEAACLCNYPEESRQQSLEQVFKLIHQWWVLKLVHEALGATSLEKDWSATQGEPYPASIFINAKGNYYTCWFELSRIEEVPPNYKGPFKSFLGMAWIRPDLLISKGKYNNAGEANKFDILIECKNLSFDKWWKDGKFLDEQLSLYFKLFNPETLIVASLKPLPGWAKKALESRGSLVIEEVYPGGKGVSELMKCGKKE